MLRNPREGTKESVGDMPLAPCIIVAIIVLALTFLF